MLIGGVKDVLLEQGQTGGDGGSVRKQETNSTDAQPVV